MPLLIVFKVMLLVVCIRLLAWYAYPLRFAMAYASILAVLGLMLILGGVSLYQAAQSPALFVLALVTLGRALLAAAYFGGLHWARDNRWWYAILPLGGPLAIL